MSVRKTKKLSCRAQVEDAQKGDTTLVQRRFCESKRDSDFKTFGEMFEETRRAHER